MTSEEEKIEEIANTMFEKFKAFMQHDPLNKARWSNLSKDIFAPKA